MRQIIEETLNIFFFLPGETLNINFTHVGKAKTININTGFVNIRHNIFTHAKKNATRYQDLGRNQGQKSWYRAIQVAV